jgi:ABC-type transport system involved in multi-copper enzyme maturation permease subunit
VSAVTPSVPKLEAPGKVTFSHVLLSEWTKFRSVRSTKWSLGIALFLTIAIPVLGAFVTRHNWQNGEGSSDDPLGGIALVGVYLAQLVIAVLGVLVMTAEYSTGAIRSTFSAVPKRLPVLWAKLVDYAAVSLVLMLLAVFVTYFATQAILSGIPQFELSLSDPGVARCLIMAAVYVMLVGVFAVALGTIVRSTAGGIATFVVLFFVTHPLVQVFPASLRDSIRKYLPLEAGIQMFSRDHGPDVLSPLGGGVVLCAYCAVAIAIAAVVLLRRDV